MTSNISSMPTGKGRPFAPGSVGLGIHALSELSAVDIVAEVMAQAHTAESAGFDGVTVSEHHTGLAGYLPHPLLVAGWILAETERIWSGPAPTLLTVRNPTLLAEELAWNAARNPGRFCAAFAAGYAPKDFEPFGLTNENLRDRFADGLEELSRALSAGGPLEGDQAVDGWVQGFSDAPLLSAAHSPAAARRAAAANMGALLIGSADVEERPRKIVDAYEKAGGTDSVVWIRRIFIGQPPEAAMRELEKAYGSWDNASKGSVNEIVQGSAEQVAEILSRELTVLGPSSALNLRVYLPGVSPAETREQIEQVGAEVLPLLAAAR